MQAVYERFDSIDPGMMLGEFTKLQQQTDTVEKYMEKFEEPGHKYKQKVLYCIINEDEDAVEKSVLEETDQNPGVLEMEDMTVSLNALSGNTDFNTLRVKGTAYRRGIYILIDSGSTHCFLDEDIAVKLGCQLAETSLLTVSVVDGSKLVSSMYCPDFSWDMQGHLFSYPVRTLRLGGCHMVLGGDWLRSHSPVEFDYDTMRVTVTKKGGSTHGEKVVLQALTTRQRPQLHMISARSMSKLLVDDHYGFVAQLHSLSTGQSAATLPADLLGLLDSFKDVFQEPSDLPPQWDIEHRIILKPEAVPRKLPPYRYSYVQKGEIETIVEGMLKAGIIRNSQSPFGSPVLLVKKKDGTWRLCVDYRYLNQMTVNHNFSIPVIDELLDELHGACYFSKIDLRSGYFQIRMKDEDVFKTSFVTHQGHYEFLVMPFGLCNAPSTFQSLMNLVFAPYLRKFILVFFDDILIYSKTWSEHLHHLHITLDILRQNQLYAKRSKCDFGQERIEYLGHIITRDGVTTDPRKVDSMTGWPVPKDVKGLWGFLGLTGYYRKFIKHYGLIARPLTKLLKKNKFVWSTAAATAFEQLKTAMVSAPVLTLPDFSKPFVLETDASDKGIGAVLMQDKRTIAYLSKALSLKNQALSVYEKEFLAPLMAVEKWKHYLIGNHFIIRTDQKSLKYILEQKVDTMLQQRWVSKLLGLDYEVQYRRGIDNKAAAALSRRDHGECSIITVIIPNWVTEVQRSYDQDPEFQPILQAKLVQIAAYPEYSLQAGRHSGITGTYKRVRSMFHWPKLKEEVAEWVRACDVCQRAKGEHVPYPGLLQPLSVSNTAWSYITMDFVEGLPKSEGKNSISVVVDRLTKYAHFIALSHPFTAEGVARIFQEEIYKLHGLPVNIVSDRDKVFTSQFWQALFRQLGTELSLSTAYHPQSDGQTERVNQCLENYLRCMCHLCPTHWACWLSMAEHWYNTNFHTGLKRTPF
ncbi:UNVERIFIED_CONTAM: Transposon Ty3-I Gag-Pol polyprotein [Sesamum radiatum]|uniref:Transposon Ty3-I Gag-Pol polyprotein n=1 Tax=Sesamum radiatum TaxID=300843 RepID=A0AAW2Q1G7_SESRA